MRLLGITCSTVLFSVVAVFPITAVSSGKLIRGGGVAPSTLIQDPNAGSGSSRAMYIPFDSSGGPIRDDVNTVCHVAFDGSALQVVSGCSTGWAQTGTVPQNIPSPFFPVGFSSPSRRGAGPFDYSNFYSSGTGSDWGDFSGDFSICVVFSAPTNVASNPVLFGDGSGTTGYEIGLNASSQFNMFSFSGAGNTATVNTVVPGSVNIACAGRSDGNMIVKLNLGTAVAAARTYAQDTTSTALLGVSSSVGKEWAGSVYELWASSTTPTDALFTTIIRRYYGLTGTLGEEVAFSRTSPATLTDSDSMLWPLSSSTPRVGCQFGSTTGCGLLLEAARTNVMLRSTAIDPVTYPTVWVPYSAGAAAAPTVTYGTADVLAPDGTVTATKVVQPTTGAGDASAVSQAFTGTVSAWSSSVWVRTLSGTCSVYLYNYISGTSYLHTAINIGSTWTNVGNVNKTLTAATWTWAIGVDTSAPSTMTGKTGCTYYLWGAQAETGAFASSTILTAGTAATRNSESGSVTNPLTDPASFCVETTATSASAWNWNSVLGGALGAANTFAFTSAANGVILYFDNYDSTATRQLVTCTPAGLSTTHTIRGTHSSNVLGVTIDGVTPACSGATSATFSAQPGTISFGVGGWTTGFKLFRKANCQ